MKGKDSQTHSSFTGRAVSRKWVLGNMSMYSASINKMEIVVYYYSQLKQMRWYMCKQKKDTSWWTSKMPLPCLKLRAFQL